MHHQFKQFITKDIISLKFASFVSLLAIMALIITAPSFISLSSYTDSGPSKTIPDVSIVSDKNLALTINYATVNGKGQYIADQLPYTLGNTNQIFNVYEYNSGENTESGNKLPVITIHRFINNQNLCLSVDTKDAIFNASPKRRLYFRECNEVKTSFLKFYKNDGIAIRKADFDKTTSKFKLKIFNFGQESTDETTTEKNVLGCIKTNGIINQQKIYPAVGINCTDYNHYTFSLKDKDGNLTPKPELTCEQDKKQDKCIPKEDTTNPPGNEPGDQCEENCDVEEPGPIICTGDDCDNPEEPFVEQPGDRGGELTGDTSISYTEIAAINLDEDIPLDINIDDEIGANLVEELKNKVMVLPNTILDKLGLSDVFNKLSEIQQNFDINRVQEVINRIKSLSSALLNTINQFKEVMMGYFEGIVEGTGQGIGNILNMVEGLFSGIKGGLSNVAELFFAFDDIKNNCVKDDNLNLVKWANCFYDRGVNDFTSISNCTNNNKGGFFAWTTQVIEGNFFGAKYRKEVPVYLPNFKGISECTTEIVLKPRFDKFVDNITKPFKEIAEGVKMLFDVKVVKAMAIQQAGELNDLLSKSLKEMVKQYIKAATAIAVENGIIAIATIFSGGAAAVGFVAKITTFVAEIAFALSKLNILKPFIKAGQFAYNKIIVPIKKVGDKIVTSIRNLKEKMKNFAGKILDKIINKLPEPLKSRLMAWKNNNFAGDGSGCNSKNTVTGAIKQTEGKCPSSNLACTLKNAVSSTQRNDEIRKKITEVQFASIGSMDDLFPTTKVSKSVAIVEPYECVNIVATDETNDELVCGLSDINTNKSNYRKKFINGFEKLEPIIQAKIETYYGERSGKDRITKIICNKDVNHRIPAGMLKDKKELKKYLFNNKVSDINAPEVTELMSPRINRVVHRLAWVACIASKNKSGDSKKLGELTSEEIASCLTTVECNPLYLRDIKSDPYFIRVADNLPKCNNKTYPTYNNIKDKDFKEYEKLYFK